MSYNALSDKNLAHHFAKPNLRRYLLRMKLIDKLGKILYNPKLDPVHTLHKRNNTEFGQSLQLVTIPKGLIYKNKIVDKPHAKLILPKIKIVKHSPTISPNRTRNLSFKKKLIKSGDYTNKSPNIEYYANYHNHKAKKLNMSESLDYTEHDKNVTVNSLTSTQLKSILLKYQKFAVIPQPIKLNKTMIN